MKKIIISMLVLFVVLSSSSSVFAKGRGRGAVRQNRQSTVVRNQNIARQKSEAAKKDLETEKRKTETERQRLRAEKGKSAENITRGKGHQQQIRAFEKQMLHEQAKYLQRKARFNRIRELAMKKGNTDVLERLRTLEEKEQGRYNKKHKRMMERMQQLRTAEGQQLMENIQTKTRTRTRTENEAEKARQRLENKTQKAKGLVEKEEE